MPNFIKQDGDNRIVHIYDTIQDMVDHATRGADPEGASHGDYGGGWSGTDTFQQAVDIAKTGWHESRPSVNALLEPLREKLADKLAIVSERSHDMTGYEPDIDRFLMGELECMYEDTFVEAPSNGRVYTLLVSGAVNSGVSAETLKKRGIAIVALVEAFQMVGSDVEIWIEESYRAMGTGHSKGRTFSCVTRIHRAGENLDIDAIMFPLAHPAWFRRFSFAECETLPRSIRDEFGFYVGGGYGHAADLCVMDIIEPTFTLTKGGERSQAKMDTDPLEFILDTLKAQGAFRDDSDQWGS